MKCLSLSNKSPDRNHRGARSAIFLQKLLISRKRKFFPILFFVLWIPLKICPVPTMHFSDRENGTVWRCIFELIKARFASLCSIKGMREPVSLFVSHKQSTKIGKTCSLKVLWCPLSSLVSVATAVVVLFFFCLWEMVVCCLLQTAVRLPAASFFFLDSTMWNPVCLDGLAHVRAHYEFFFFVLKRIQSESFECVWLHSPIVISTKSNLQWINRRKKNCLPTLFVLQSRPHGQTLFLFGSFWGCSFTSVSQQTTNVNRRGKKWPN